MRLPSGRFTPLAAHSKSDKSRSDSSFWENSRVDFLSERAFMTVPGRSISARDLKYLCRQGYEVKKVKGCDMFPETVHVETVALLSR